jgi:hypothetical protein
MFKSFREIENLFTLKEPADKARIFWTFLKGQDLIYFEHHLSIRMEAEDSERSDNDLIEIVLRKMYIGLEFIL